jgi:hypothetical protein
MTVSQSQPVLAPRGAIGEIATSADYEVRNAIGTLLFTSPDLKLAKAWLSECAAQWPGAQVNEVLRWRTERRVYKPVAYLRAVRS